MANNFINLMDIPAEQLRAIIDDGKLEDSDGNEKILANKFIALLFDSPSLRTRVSFQIAVTQLGGSAITISNNEIQLGQRESPQDISKVLGTYVDGIVIRNINHANITAIANAGDISVINGMSSYFHPCQVMADILTFEQCKKSLITGRRIAWVGACNNMLNSFVNAAGAFKFQLAVAVPECPDINQSIIKQNRELGAEIELSSDPQLAVRNSDCVVTDTWISAGESKNKDIKALQQYQVNSQLMSLAKKDAIFMHCLPAYRGHEVTSEVIDGEQSVVFKQVANRLEVQKSILKWCFNKL